MPQPPQYASQAYPPVGISPVQPKKLPPPPPPAKPVEPLACDSILLDLASFKKPGKPGPSNGIASPVKKKEEAPKAVSEAPKVDTPKVGVSISGRVK